MNSTRSALFQRNESLEALLKELEADLQPSEDRLVEHYRNRDMAWPVVFVMGPLRSGTTLFMQWLASSGHFAYPTNLLSRFYMAPILGAKIQQLFTNPRFRFRDELSDFAGQVDFRSENGKTSGILAPNEFWYFWRRLLSDPRRDVWTDAELEQGLDIGILRAKLAGMTDVFGKPFAAKGMLFNYNIPFLAGALEKAVFIRIRRDRLANCISAWEARKRQFGDATRWYSFEIPEFAQLAELSSIEQVAGQIFHIEQAIDRGFATLAPSRKLEVSYEAFCDDPGQTYRQPPRLLHSDSTGLGKSQGPPRFEASRRTEQPDAAQFIKALERFPGNLATDPLPLQTP